MSFIKCFDLPVILDGATGTELIRRGMPQGECTEKFILESPHIMTALQSEYLSAGSNTILAPTFGANTSNLTRHGFDEAEVDDVCRRLVDISKKAAAESGHKALIGGDMSPTGLIPEPYGSTSPDEIISIYKKQASVLISCGVDFISIETMISLAEAKLAVIAVREVSDDIPIFVTFTVGENGRTMNGDRLDACLMTLYKYGITAFGVNCSTGPDIVYNALCGTADTAEQLGVPLIAKPNAGLPVEDERGTHFSVSPAEMAAYVKRFFDIGAYIIGGCCGTSPEYIAEISKTAASLRVNPSFTADGAKYASRFVSTSRIIAEIDSECEYIKITEADEDTLYDLCDEAEADEVLYLELGEGAGKLLVSMDTYIANPLCLIGNEDEIRYAERYMCRKLRSL